VADLRQDLRLARRSDGWELLVYSDDPESAVELANAWADAALKRIKVALEHAIRAGELQSALYVASCSLEPAPLPQEGALWVCASADPPQDAGGLPEALVREVSLSQGILPAFTYSLQRQATLPGRPVAWGRADLALAGVGLGLVLGFGYVMWCGRMEP
jgi:hypothetical protein